MMAEKAKKWRKPVISGPESVLTLAPLGFESAIRAALATGKAPPAPKPPKPKISYRPRERKDGAWEVVMTPPTGAPTNVGDFRTEAEALKWIKERRTKARLNK